MKDQDKSKYNIDMSENKNSKNIYDISLKDTISGLEGAFTELFLGFKIKSASKPLNLELSKIEEKKADFLCKITDLDDKESILHIEFQTSNHKDMHFRMLRYLTELYKAHKLPIIQLVIYLGDGKMNMSDNISFSCHETTIDYKYKLVNISDLDCKDFVDSDNSDLVVLGILCDFKNKDAQEIVHKICKRLEELCKDDTNELKNKFLKLETFSKLRKLENIVAKEEEMLETTIKVSDLPSYGLGHTQGLSQGKQQEKIEIAKLSLNQGLNESVIALITGLSIEEVKKLKDS
jgi:predicted transposase/invertase (TIGR01784 family)